MSNLPMILDAAGVIIEPYQEPTPTRSFWTFPIIFGTVLSLLAIVINVILRFTKHKNVVSWIDTVLMAVLLGVLGVTIGCFVSSLVGIKEDSSFVEAWEKDVADSLSEHYGVEVHPYQIKNTNLLRHISAGSVTSLEFSNSVSRDPDTGEWSREVRSFLVDGKVVEINSVKSPLEGERFPEKLPG